MVFKNRYLIMEVLFSRDDGEGEGFSLSQKSLSKAIKDSLLLTFGEYGLGSSLSSLQVKYVNPITKLCVIRCNRAEYEKIWCAITFITSINNCPLFFNLLDLSGNIRSCKDVALEYDKKKLELLKLKMQERLSEKQIEAAKSCMETLPLLEN